jgi:tRNA nucleotidyltransferase/poly(A) polymerase
MTLPGEPRSKPPCDRTDALAVLDRLRKAGHTAYFAGGCVRDLLLGLPPKDWDIATDAPPQRVREIFPDTQAVGAAFGVILVRQGQSVVEVATFRTDNAYEDGRRPTSVRFTSAQEDAQRRDFTINGLFLDPFEDRVIDFVDGRRDIEARRLRAIGNASERFEEDHLRLLRAVRFAARFDLEIEPATAEAIRSSAPRLRGISPERVGDELRLMLTPPSRRTAWGLLWSLGLGPMIFRFLPHAAQTLDMRRSIFLKVARDQPVTFGLALAAATLCVRVQTESPADISILLSKPQVGQCVRAMRQALRISNAESDEMAGSLGALGPLLQAQLPTLAQRKRFAAGTTAPLSLALMEGLAAADFYVDRIAQLRKELATLRPEDLGVAPLISGDDLTAAGFVPGPIFRRILEALYDAQLEGTLTNKEQAMRMAREVYERGSA